MRDLRAELSEALGEIEWSWLVPHAKRDALVLVTQSLNLLDVGVAIADNNVTSIQHWIGEQLIYKPSGGQLSHWNQNPAKRFNALIVQPYVLAQERDDRTP